MLLPSITLLSALGLIASSAAVRQTNVAVDNRTLDELYVEALKEDGQLNVWGGGDAGVQGAGIRAGWAARFPNITLNYTVNVSKYHGSRINRNFWTNAQNPDVGVFQTLQDFTRWKEEGRLLFYKPSNFDDIYNGEKDADGAFLPVAVYSFGDFWYDTTSVSQADVPRSYADLLDPKWKSKIVLTYPNDDDAVAYLFSIIIERYGFQWLERLVAQDVSWVRGSGTPAFHIIDNHYNLTSPFDQPNTGRVISFTTTGYYGPQNSSFFQTSPPVAPEQKFSWSQTAAAFNATTRPATAKLFLAWMTSYETQGPQSTLFKSTDEGQIYTSNITQPIGFRTFMDNRERVEWWKLQYEDIITTPQGPPPMALYP